METEWPWNDCEKKLKRNVHRDAHLFVEFPKVTTQQQERARNSVYIIR